jgi:very-short-patch-repair endonuclease
VRERAEQQHGVVSRDQCRLAGISMRAELARGDWEVLSPRVLRLRGAPRTARSRLMAAVLDAGGGAAASHGSAAALWRLPGFRLVPCEVVRPHGGDQLDVTLGRLHRSRSLPAHHVTVLDAIPVTTPARTLFDLAGVLHPLRTARAVDNALAKSPALLRALHRMLPELAERGRTGIRAMREILAARPLGYVPPASGLEARAIQILEEAGIRVRRQVDLGGDDWIGRVDLLVEGTNLAIEIDSARYHSSLFDRERDARRDEALRAAGLEVVRVAAEDVWSAPSTVVRSIRKALRASGPKITRWSAWS